MATYTVHAQQHRCQSRSLFTNVAEPPEIPIAISHQSAGMLELVGHPIYNGSCRGGSADMRETHGHHLVPLRTRPRL